MELQLSLQGEVDISSTLFRPSNECLEGVLPLLVFDFLLPFAAALFLTSRRWAWQNTARSTTDLGVA